MKIKVSLLIVVLLAGSAVLAVAAGVPKLSVKEVRYDAGKVKQGQQVTHVFEITNAGTAALIITGVQPS